MSKNDMYLAAAIKGLVSRGILHRYSVIVELEALCFVVMNRGLVEANGMQQDIIHEVTATVEGLRPQFEEAVKSANDQVRLFPSDTILRGASLNPPLDEATLYKTLGYC